MNFVKKILVVHGAASARRRMMSLLSDSGFDVRAFSALEAAIENARFETFDLALVGHGISGGREISFIQTLKQIQAKLPVMLLATRVEMMLLEDRREGLAGVLVLDEDTKVLMRQIRAELHMEEPVEVTAEDMAQVESTLQALAGQSDAAAAIGTLSAQLARERAELDAWRARLASEEERSLTDSARFQQDHRQLAEAQQRFATDMERLHADEERLHAEAQRFHQENQQLAEAQQRFAADMEKLRVEEETLKAQYEQLQESREQAAEEIRAARAAAVMAAAAATPAQPSLLAENSVFESEDALRAAWSKFKREIDILEAERAMMVDDKLVMESHQHALKQREEKVRDREIKVTVREKKMAEATAAASNAASYVVTPVTRATQAMNATSARPPLPSRAPVASAARPAAPAVPVKVTSESDAGSMFGALTRAPLEMAKGLFGAAKKA